jgi:general secretion pathway protein G
MYDTKTKRMTAAELLIVVLILTTLAAISVPRLSHSATLDKQARCNSNIELLHSAVKLYSMEKGKFPDTLEEVINNREFFPAGVPKCPLGGTYILKSDHTVICTHP